MGSLFIFCRHNIFWLSRSSREIETPPHSWWWGSEIHMKRPSLRWMVLHSYESTCPMYSNVLASISWALGHLLGIRKGGTFCKKYSWDVPGIVDHGREQPSTFCLWDSVDQIWTGPISFHQDWLPMITLNGGISTSIRKTTSMPYISENRLAPVDVYT